MVNICVYIHLYKKNINIISFQYTIMMLLIMHMYYLIREEKTESKNMDFLIEQLIKHRNTYFNKHNKHLLDDTPFREFIIECLGKTIDSNRKFFLSVTQKRKEKKRLIFNYDPTGSHPNFKPESYKFSNTSGNIIKNDMFLIINNSTHK